jgi:hypothetical protein
LLGSQVGVSEGASVPEGVAVIHFTGRVLARVAVGGKLTIAESVILTVVVAGGVVTGLHAANRKIIIKRIDKHLFIIPIPLPVGAKHLPVDHSKTRIIPL